VRGDGDRAAQLASSLGALDSVDVEQGLGVGLQQAPGSVMTLLEVESAGARSARSARSAR
jgi:hypothetical protein